jgi:hypothetical protein
LRNFRAVMRQFETGETLQKVEFIYRSHCDEVLMFRTVTRQFETGKNISFADWIIWMMICTGPLSNQEYHVVQIH